MSTVSINLTKLESAADKATSITDALAGYAEELPGVVNTPLGRLEGGSSRYTSTAASRASAKARSLDARSDDYTALSQRIGTFVSAVRQADASVERSIEAITVPYVEAMSFWQRASYYFDAEFNDLLGSTALGKALNVLHDTTELFFDFQHDALVTVYDYFKYGDGKYVLDIVISGLAAIGAVLGALACFPISGIAAAILAGCAFVAAAVSVADFGFTVYSNIKALSLNGTEPGLAHYYGDVDSVSDWANKTSTDATWRGLASGFDFAGQLAGIASFAAGWTKNVSSGSKVSKVAKDYFAGKFGLTWSDASQTYTFSAKTLFGVKDWSTLNCFEKAGDVVSWTKRSLSGAQTLIDGVDSTSDVFDITFDICGGLSGESKIYSLTKRAYSAMTSK